MTRCPFALRRIDFLPESSPLAPTCRLEVNHVDTFSEEQEVVTLNTLRIGPIV